MYARATFMTEAPCSSSQFMKSDFCSSSRNVRPSFTSIGNVNTSLLTNQAPPPARYGRTPSTNRLPRGLLRTAAASSGMAYSPPAPVEENWSIMAAKGKEGHARTMLPTGGFNGEMFVSEDWVFGFRLKRYGKECELKYCHMFKGSITRFFSESNEYGGGFIFLNPIMTIKTIFNDTGATPAVKIQEAHNHGFMRKARQDKGIGIVRTQESKVQLRQAKT